MPNALQQLISHHCEVTGETLKDVADRAGLSRQTLSALMHRADKGQLPRMATLDALAVGLGLSPSTVKDAARSSVLGTDHADGHDGQYDGRVVVLIDHARRMTPRQVDVLLATARALQALDTPS
jgi:transcriptional regulator with XRE-family HTH domain